LDNAIKFTRAGSTRVATKKRDTGVVVSIKGQQIQEKIKVVHNMLFRLFWLWS
jgi:signal transduction histidine kinase